MLARGTSRSPQMCMRRGRADAGSQREGGCRGGRRPPSISAPHALPQLPPSIWVQRPGATRLRKERGGGAGRGGHRLSVAAQPPEAQPPPARAWRRRLQHQHSPRNGAAPGLNRAHTGLRMCRAGSGCRAGGQRAREAPSERPQESAGDGVSEPVAREGCGAATRVPALSRGTQNAERACGARAPSFRAARARASCVFRRLPGLGASAVPRSVRSRAWPANSRACVRV